MRYNANTASTIGQVNAELEKIQEAIGDTLSREGDSPNQMQAVLDMNSNRVINGTTPVSNKDLATKEYVDNALSTSNLVGADRPPVIEQSQTLLSSQVVVTYAPPIDLAQSVVYLTGNDADEKRLFVNTHFFVISPTELQLFESYPAGSTVTVLQETT